MHLVLAICISADLAALRIKAVHNIYSPIIHLHEYFPLYRYPVSFTGWHNYGWYTYLQLSVYKPLWTTHISHLTGTEEATTGMSMGWHSSINRYLSLLLCCNFVTNRDPSTYVKYEDFEIGWIVCCHWASEHAFFIKADENSENPHRSQLRTE